MARLVVELRGKNAEAQMKRLTKEAKKLGLETRRLKTGVDKADRSLKKFGGGLKGLAGAAGLSAVTLALRSATTAAIEQAQAEAQLAQGIKSTGGAAGQTADALKRYASGLQRLTTFSDEAIIRSQSILLTFTKIQGETFPATTRAVLDLAARMGTDLPAAAIQLGKALNDPVANLGELGRAGIQFTKEQKEVIKVLWEGGRAAESQAIILEELTTQFGGSAEAAAKAAGGGYKQAINAFRDMSEGLGSALLPTLDSAGRVFAKSGGSLKKFAETITLTILPMLLVGKAWQKITGPGEEVTKGVLEQTQRFIELSDAIGDVNLLLIDNHSLEVDNAVALVATNKALEDEEDRLKKLAKAAEDAARKLRDILASVDALIPSLADAAEETLEFQRRMEALDELEIDPFKGLLNADGNLNLLGGAADLDTLLGDTEPAFDELKGKFEGLGGQVFGILSGAIISALRGKGVNYEQLGSALGTIIGNAIAPGVGGAIGGLIGGLAGSLFGGGKSGPSFSEQLTALADQISDLRSDVSPLVGQIADMFDEFRLLMQDAIKLNTNYEAVLDATRDKIEQLRDTILGINVEDFGQRLLAALALNQNLGLTDLGQLGGSGGVGGPGVGADGDAGGLSLLRAMAPAIDGAAESAGNLNSVLGETSDIYGVVGINVSAFAEQLAGEFAGVSFEFQSVQATATALRDAIAELNLTEEDQLRLIGLVTQAEQVRMATLENDVLQRLVNVLSQIPGLQEESARLQQQINQARFQIEVRMIELQLNAMGLMTAAFAQMLQVAVAFGQELGNFASGGGGGGFNFRAPRGLRGGGRRGARQAARDRAREDMERLIDTLRGLANEPAFNTLNDRMRELHQTFFGPGGFAEEARRLGVSMDLVNAAFRRQRQNLMDEANRGIRQFLEGLGTSRFNPGGLRAQFGSARSAFDDLLRSARGGDLDARAALPGASQQLLDLGGPALGTSSAAFRHLFEMVQGSLEGLLGIRGGTVLGFEARAQVTAINAVQASVDRVGDILLGSFGVGGQASAVQGGEQVAEMQAMTREVTALRQETADLRADTRAARVEGVRHHQNVRRSA